MLMSRTMFAYVSLSAILVLTIFLAGQDVTVVEIAEQAEAATGSAIDLVSETYRDITGTNQDLPSSRESQSTLSNQAP